MIFKLRLRVQAFPTYVLQMCIRDRIQPHLPIRLPCYDFTPVTCPAFGSSLLSVGSLTSGVADSHGVTGGVYKTRELSLIHISSLHHQFHCRINDPLTCLVHFCLHSCKCILAFYNIVLKLSRSNQIILLKWTSSLNLLRIEL